MSKYLYAPGTLRELCVCGHHRDTHFQEPTGARGACLGVHCDDCHVYRDEFDKNPPKNQAPPRATPSDPWSPDDDAPETEPPASPAPHYGPWGFPLTP